MIDKRLIGKWWAYYRTKYNTVTYAVYKGESPPKESVLPDDAVTKWHFPQGLDGKSTPIDTGLYNDSETTTWFTKGITFPPLEYLNENSITEFEILPNGDYLIFDSINF